MNKIWKNLAIASIATLSSVAMGTNQVNAAQFRFDFNSIGFGKIGEGFLDIDDSVLGPTGTGTYALDELGNATFNYQAQYPSWSITHQTPADSPVYFEFQSGQLTSITMNDLIKDPFLEIGDDMSGIDSLFAVSGGSFSIGPSQSFEIPVSGIVPNDIPLLSSLLSSNLTLSEVTSNFLLRALMSDIKMSDVLALLEDVPFLEIPRIDSAFADILLLDFIANNPQLLNIPLSELALSDLLPIMPLSGVPLGQTVYGSVEFQTEVAWNGILNQGDSVSTPEPNMIIALVMLVLGGLLVKKNPLS
ncbi:MAG: hypothetical protein F6K40_27420 [Okeania sp. SIO3I5]|uniref:hypothetical protein n=1 Tax=Okeania sp. SIO3I5 TaxID=2607805 RepID=UPI0013BBC9B3|nr:hypothetical protein [Okeania sp. SIO3I5]NEQ39776.1 hypothetical protein [Okeania sp. SIO3I5]